MKYSIVALLIFITLSCKHSDVNQLERARIEESIMSSQLINHLDSLIESQDSLSKVDSRFSKHNSYWILFSENEEKCFVRILANFNFYQKDNMDGFLKYREKTITFYNTKSKCNENIIDVSRINTLEDKIENIVDYNDAIVPPHEPEIMLFEVKENGVLVSSKL